MSYIGARTHAHVQSQLHTVYIYYTNDNGIVAIICLLCCVAAALIVSLSLILRLSFFGVAVISTVRVEYADDDNNNNKIDDNDNDDAASIAISMQNCLVWYEFCTSASVRSFAMFGVRLLSFSLSLSRSRYT